jgi:hypothetical protein
MHCCVSGRLLEALLGCKEVNINMQANDGNTALQRWQHRCAVPFGEHRARAAAPWGSLHARCERLLRAAQGGRQQRPGRRAAAAADAS